MNLKSATIVSCKDETTTTSELIYSKWMGYTCKYMYLVGTGNS